MGRRSFLVGLTTVPMFGWLADHSPAHAAGPPVAAGAASGAHPIELVRHVATAIAEPSSTVPDAAIFGRWWDAADPHMQEYVSALASFADSAPGRGRRLHATSHAECRRFVARWSDAGEIDPRELAAQGISGARSGIDARALAAQLGDVVATFVKVDPAVQPYACALGSWPV